MILTKTPLAPCRSKLSSNGLLNAVVTASIALFSPEDTPEPIIALPIPDITVLTSAKSTFIKPLIVIISVIPFTAPLSTALAFSNDEKIDSLPPYTSFNFELGITINESTHCSRLLIPS